MNNVIAFHITIALFLKAIRASYSHEADLINIKLANRAAPGDGPTQNRTRPMLIFSCKGESVALAQEMPVGNPCKDAELADLQNRLCHPNVLCPFYLDICPHAEYIKLCVDKFKPLANDLRLSLTRQGDLHLSIIGNGVTLGQGIPGMEPLWHRAEGEPDPPQLISERMEDRLREAIALRDGSVASALVDMKHLMTALHSALMTTPQRVLCGIRNVDSNLNADTGAAGSYVHFMFSYEHPIGQDGKFPMELFFKLPIREEK